MPNSQFSSTSKIKLDVRKFLGNINKKSFAGQINLVERKLERLAKEFDTNLRLVSHFGNQIYFEDTNSNSYFQADLNKDKNNRVFHIENIKQIVIEDEEKAKVFDDACYNLVEAIEESLDDEDSSRPDTIFEKIIKGYCNPKVIPESGVVKTWDGNRHHINVNSSIISEDAYPEVVKTLKEAVKSSEVVIKEGSITIGEDKAQLPINETTRRLSVARNMKTVAESAYKSTNFNRLMKTVAGHISNDNTRDAVSILKSFLTEEQEFTMLDKKGIYTLVENSLYSQGIFNYHVVKNTALMLWEANCHLNKQDIIKEWSKAASKCDNKQLRENVEILKESSNKSPVVFSDTFDTFLGKIFNEDSSTRTIKAKSYLNMLKTLNNVVDSSDADAAVKNSVDDLILRLESDVNNVDDATLYEVEDLLASVSADLINDTSTLSDFDTIPEPAGVDEFGTDEDLGDFEGDMGDLGGFGGGLDAEEDLGAEEDLNPEAEAEAEEEVEDELQLADIMRDAKPIQEMKAEDIKIVLEAIKNMKPEAIEVDGEFTKMLKKGLTESEASFVKKVMSRSKDVNEDLFEQITSVYYDLMISENSEAKKEESDLYSFEGTGEIEVNDSYTGIKEEKDEDEDEKKGGKSEAGVEGAEEDGKEATESSDSKEEPIKEDGLDIEGHNKPDEEDDDKDGDYDDNNVEESMAVVADSDEALIDIIAQVLDKEDNGDDEGGENDDEEDGEVIADEGEDPHAAALGRKSDDEQDTAGPEDDRDPHAVALSNKDEDSKWSKEADPDQDGNPIWKDEDDQAMEEKESEEDAVSEDNDITEPTKFDYDSEKAADQDGHGKTVNPKPKFSDKDYDGSKGANTGKQKPGSGHPNT